MSKSKKITLEVKGEVVTVLSGKDLDYISLTDIAQFKKTDQADDVIPNWLRSQKKTAHPL